MSIGPKATIQYKEFPAIASQNVMIVTTAPASASHACDELFAHIIDKLLPILGRRMEALQIVDGLGNQCPRRFGGPVKPDQVGDDIVGIATVRQCGCNHRFRIFRSEPFFGA